MEDENERITQFFKEEDQVKTLIFNETLESKTIPLKRNQFIRKILRSNKRSVGLSLLSRLHAVLLFPFACVFSLLIIVLRPVVKVRLGLIVMARIGGAYPVLWYISEQKRGRHKGKFFDLFFYQPYTNVCNRQWWKMIKRQVVFMPFRKLGLLTQRLLSSFPYLKEHIIFYPHPPSNETLQDVFDYQKPLLTFTTKEELFGERQMEEMGIPKGKPFICFHSRDASYLDTVFPDRDWNYHNYRDTSIKNYLPAAEYLANKGYCALRAGSIVAEKLSTNNPAIIDYARDGKRSDFMDIYLGAKCRFFIGSDCGITIIPEAFKRPMIYTNWVSVEALSTFYHHALVIMKKWYSLKEERYLTFSEMLKVGNHYEINLEDFGVKLIDNTPEEIIDVIEEMEQRLEGTWQSTAEDEELQNRFWDLYGRERLRFPAFRIGAKFLRQHQQLLN